MEIVEVKCQSCGKGLFVLKNVVKEKMFCTLGCMGSYTNIKKMKANEINLF
jgi:hypothetical protein